jgi:hypothetical protein
VHAPETRKQGPQQESPGAISGAFGLMPAMPSQASAELLLFLAHHSFELIVIFEDEIDIALVFERRLRRLQRIVFNPLSLTDSPSSHRTACPN